MLTQPIASDFNADLAYTLEHRKNDVINQTFYSILPGLIKIVEVTDLTDQLRGIDKILHFQNGSKVTVDIKVRRTAYRQNGEPDILLEQISNDKTNRPGWMITAECDYIAYFIEPIGKVYLLPVMALRMAYDHYGRHWERIYPKAKAPNKGYNSIGLCVPASVLYKAMVHLMNRDYKPGN